MGNLSFPWSDVDGLAPILRDRRIWPRIFEDRNAREAVQAVAKRTLVTPFALGDWGINSFEDKVFGELAIGIMANRRARLKLASYFRKHLGQRNLNAYIAQRLFVNFVCAGRKWENCSAIPSPPEVCEERNEKWYILPTHFQKWLASQELADANRSVIALFACAFAILQPRDALQLHCVLLQRDSAFSELLGGEAVKDVNMPPTHIFHDTASAQSAEQAFVRAEYERKIEELRSTADQLAIRLQVNADELKTNGVLHDLSLLDELRGHKETHAALCNQLMEYVRAAKLSPSLLAHMPANLSELRSLVSEIARVCQQGQQLRTAQARVAELLTYLRDIECPSDEGLLNIVRLRLDKLRNTTLSLSGPSNDEIIMLLENSHPLQDFVRFVNDLRTLDTKDWNALYQSVQLEFGQELATAVVRGKVRVRAKPSGDTEKSPASMPGNEQPGDLDCGSTESELAAEGEPKIESQSNEADFTSGDDHSVSDEQLFSPNTRPNARIVKPAAVGSPTPPAQTPQGHDKDGNREVNDSLSVCQNAKDATPEHLSQTATHAKGAFDPITALLNLALGFVRDRQLQYALHLSEYIEAHCDTSHSSTAPIRVPAAVFRALAISRYVEPASGEHLSYLTDSLTQCYEYLVDTASCLIEKEALHLFAFAAALYPSLIAPTAEALEILKIVDIPNSLSELKVLREAIIEFSRFGCRANKRDLKGLVDHDVWASDLQELQSRAETWLAHARQNTIIFAPTTDVWRKWLEADGPLGSLFAEIALNRREREKEVKERIAYWSSHENIDSELKKTDRRIRGRSAELRRIEARAVAAIRNKVKDALAYVTQWLQLISKEPTKRETYTVNAIAKCRRTVQTQLDPIYAAIKSLSQASQISIGMQSALSAIQSAVSAVQALFDPEATEPKQVTVAEAVNLELLRLPLLELDDDWRPIRPSDEAIASSLLSVAQHQLTWSEAFDEHCRLENYKAAQAILELASRGLIKLEDPRPFEQLTGKLQDSRASLQRAKESLDREMQRALFEGALTHDEFQAMVARIDVLQPENATDFRPLRLQLREITNDLGTFRFRHAGEVEDRLNTLGLAQSNLPVVSRIRSFLNAGDVRTALEFLALHEQGQQIPDTPAKNPGSDFPEFLEQLEALYRGVRQVVTPDLIRSIRDRRCTVIPGFESADPEKARAASDFLQIWQELCNKTTALDEKVLALMQRLGFESAQLTRVVGRPSDNQVWLKLTTTPIADRSRCPIPLFGSDARGHYNILAIWGKPLEGDIVLKEPPQQSRAPIIVLYLGAMDTRRRRDLAHRCRKERRSLLVLDDFLLLFLARQAELRSRLAEFFYGAIQFTYSAPFTTTAGHVPNEMFYGRVTELEQIASPNDSHLIFGGRQLGKTALLRHLERIGNVPQAGRIIRWIDLTNNCGIGLNRPIADIWLVISNVLSEHAIMPKNITTFETVERYVVEWLEKDPHRSIVLLLDEADLFLESDSKGEETRERIAGSWAHTRRLKAICERTQRRFKFVFAGLHNVQRSARDTNSPIAHLGSAICIGPFLSGSEMNAAREMVRQPFSALGYRFESDDLIMRILAYTNYYPSLIQLFCKHLLEYLGSERAAFTPAKTPPYYITLRHIEDAYQSRSLHNAIMERFNWTLRLDPRYRVIALVIADVILSDATGSSCWDGLPLNDIRHKALQWWKRGFVSDSSIDGFRAILDEMIGLGVLREASKGRYTFRSQNVVKMLGTRPQIDDALLEVSEEEPRIQYQASTFRRADAKQHWRRSPLTAQQESTILAFESHSQVTIIYGSVLSGIEDVSVFLRMLRPESRQIAFVDIKDSGGVEGFAKALDHALKQAAEGETLILISSDCRWDSEWVLHAQERLERRRGSKAISLVFLADPMRAWQYLTANHAETAASGPRTHVTEMSLRPWSDEAVRRLLDIVGAVDNEATRKNILHTTGNWHYLVSQLAQNCNHDQEQLESYIEAIESSLRTVELRDRLLWMPQHAHDILKVLAQLHPEAVGVEDLLTLVPELSDAKRIGEVLHWADRLQYVEPQGADKWILNPLVRLMLSF